MAPVTARPASQPLTGTRVQPQRTGKDTRPDRWAGCSYELSDENVPSSILTKHARQPAAKTAKPGGRMAVRPAARQASCATPASELAASASHANVVQGTPAIVCADSTLAALETGELAAAELLPPAPLAPVNSHATQAFDAAADAKMLLEADVEAMVQRMMKSRDQQLELALSKLATTEHRLAVAEKRQADAEEQLSATQQRVRQLERAQPTAASSGLSQTPIEGQEATGVAPTDRSIDANTDVVMAHGMVCEGVDAQDFSTEDEGMLDHRVEVMLREGLHLEGVEVLKVERLKLRNPAGKIPPVRVRVASKGQRDDVLRAASQLRNSDGFRKVYLQPDLSPEQQLRKRLAMGRFRELRKKSIVCAFRLDRIWIREKGRWFPDGGC